LSLLFWLFVFQKLQATGIRSHQEYRPSQAHPVWPLSRPTPTMTPPTIHPYLEFRFCLCLGMVNNSTHKTLPHTPHFPCCFVCVLFCLFRLHIFGCWFLMFVFRVCAFCCRYNAVVENHDWRNRRTVCNTPPHIQHTHIHTHTHTLTTTTLTEGGTAQYRVWRIGMDPVLPPFVLWYSLYTPDYPCLFVCCLNSCWVGVLCVWLLCHPSLTSLSPCKLYSRCKKQYVAAVLEIC
jgi:hypothetical protein